jgi:hypothetical protein
MADETESATSLIGADPSPGANRATAPVFEPASDFVVKTEHLPAAARIRAFEDEHLGKDCVRIGSQIERGYGSRFKELSDEKRRQHATLEKLIDAEQKLVDAHAALIQAEADHEAALVAAEPKPDATPSE